MNDLATLNMLSEGTLYKNVMLDLENLFIKYNSAIKEMQTKIEILNEDFTLNLKYNPIEHIKSRIKTPESIANKLLNHEYPITLENMINHVNDIAGIRIICSFLSDVYYIAGMIAANEGIHVLEVQDYIRDPKESRYKSYHMLVSVPIYLTTGKEYIKVEIQIRTSAMDFWASIEHKIKYKFNGIVPEEVSSELLKTSVITDNLDDTMSRLNQIVQNYNK